MDLKIVFALMNPKSLLITLSNQPRITVQDTLLKDHVSTEIDGVPVFASVPPWNPMHDLLVDRETQTLAGIVYPVPAREQAAIANICRSLPKQVIRYCISPVSAAAVLRNPQIDLSDKFDIAGDVNVSVKQFPEALRPYRQMLRGCLLGEIERDQIPSDLLRIAGKYFEENGTAAHLEDWVTGGANVDRVEVTWMRKPMDPQLPSYFPSDLKIELAQYFAEDIWFYRENEVYAIGINHLDKMLSDYDLRLSKSLQQ